MGDRMKKTKALLHFLKDVHKDSGKSYVFLLKDFIHLKRTKGISIEEYRNFRFENQGKEFRDSFLSGAEQRPFIDLLNPKKYYTIARNKYFAHLFLAERGVRTSELYCYYNPEGRVQYGNIAFDHNSVVNVLKKQQVRSCVIKTTETSYGNGVIVVKDIEYLKNGCLLHLFDDTDVELMNLLQHEPLVFESLIKQTAQVESFNASSVNTVRFMTTLYPSGEVKIIATFMKIGRNGRCVDNAGSGGNVDAAVDIASGRIYNTIQFNGYRNIKSITHHPDSGNLIEGVVIENWKKIKEDVKQFQRSMPFLKAIGWDIAITDNGPVVIEMNDYWDRTGQLFLGYGWKKEIQECYEEWKRLEEVGKISYKMERR